MADAATTEKSWTYDELLSFRLSHEAPGWNYRGDYSSGQHLSDAQVASRVRMLMRSDLDHEAVCVLGRDRIRDLSRQRDALHQALQEVVRLRLATDEGTCAARFDRAWDVATAALAAAGAKS